jgi:hypothetical protein
MNPKVTEKKEIALKVKSNLKPILLLSLPVIIILMLLLTTIVLVSPVLLIVFSIYIIFDFINKIHKRKTQFNHNIIEFKSKKNV